MHFPLFLEVINGRNDTIETVKCEQSNVTDAISKFVYETDFKELHLTSLVNLIDCAFILQCGSSPSPPSSFPSAFRAKRSEANRSSCRAPSRSAFPTSSSSSRCGWPLLASCSWDACARQCRRSDADVQKFCFTFFYFLPPVVLTAAGLYIWIDNDDDRFFSQNIICGWGVARSGSERAMLSAAFLHVTRWSRCSCKLLYTWIKSLTFIHRLFNGMYM